MKWTPPGRRLDTEKDSSGSPDNSYPSQQTILSHSALFQADNSNLHVDFSGEFLRKERFITRHGRQSLPDTRPVVRYPLLSPKLSNFNLPGCVELLFRRESLERNSAIKSTIVDAPRIREAFREGRCAVQRRPHGTGMKQWA